MRLSHPTWCGQACSECRTNCSLDESIPCSPDCEGLNTVTGKPDSEHCKDCETINK